MTRQSPHHRRRPIRLGILAKTAYLSWLVTLITLATFVAVILPSQRQAFLENLASKAHGVSVSLQDVAAGAVVTEDYGTVVDHSLRVLEGDPTIEFLVLTRNDGFSLVSHQDGWSSEEMPKDWHPADRITRQTLARPDFIGVDVFQYSRPFDYSGIEWGWIHVGLSLDSFRAHLRTSYSRTAWLAAVCLLLSLGASVVYARLMVAPILSLRAVAQRVAEGDLGARADVRSGDEVEGLANAFNAMTQSVQDRDARMRAQSQQLAALALDPAVRSGDLTAAGARIAQVAVDTMAVERAGVWLFTEDREAIECLSQCSGGGRSIERGHRLLRAGNEPYFRAIADGRTLAASNAWVDPRTACFAEEYLRPSGITSMLDAGIRVGGAVVGMVCLEHKGEARVWTLEDEAFAASLADLSALALEARERRTAAEMLSRQDALLEATRFAVEKYLHAADWAECVDEVLAQVGAAIRADRVYVFRNVTGEDGTLRANLAFEWVAPGVVPHLRDPAVQGDESSDLGFDWWKRSLESGQLIRRPVAEMLPGERQALERHGIKAILVAPVFVGEEWWGEVAVNDYSEARDWLPAEVDCLLSVADGLGTSMQKQRAQAEAVAARRAAEAASQAKSQFLANMSHEIRTPMNGVLGMLQILGNEDLTQKQGRFVAAARSSAETLLGVIGDVLDFSKIEAGHLDLEQVDFSLRDTVDGAIRLLAEKAESKQLELTYAVAPGLPDGLVGDPDRLRQVLINLVGNAVKFTEVGEVHVWAEPGPQAAEGVQVRFSVRDSGPGIPAGQLESIFESFSQGDASMLRRHGGTGLGLAISRHLVSLMGGEISVESEVGRGCVFSFMVRLGLSAKVMACPSEVALGPAECRVLVVDDAPSSREVVSEHLRAWGCPVGEAANAAQAMGELQRAAANRRPYSIAVIDALMPGPDGYRLAQLIRSDPRLASTLLVLLSGFEAPSPENLTECGIQAVVAKPVRASDLHDALATVTSGSWSYRRHSAGPLQPVVEPRYRARILLAEDNEINQEVAREMITRLGHACECVDSGREVLEAASTGGYDLILMDCQMPIMDGYAASEAIRSWEHRTGSGRRIPIVALTAHALTGDRDRCLASGMDDYLTKPLQAAGLAAMLEKWLGSGQGASAASEAVSGLPAPADGVWDEASVEQAVVERCLGKRALASRLLGLFLQQLHEDLGAIEAGVAEPDAGKVTGAAHRLKGAAANLSLHVCQRAAAEMMCLGRDGRTGGLEPYLATLRAQADLIATMRLVREAGGAPEAMAVEGGHRE